MHNFLHCGIFICNFDLIHKQVCILDLKSCKVNLSIVSDILGPFVRCILVVVALQNEVEYFFLDRIHSAHITVSVL